MRRRTRNEDVVGVQRQQCGLFCDPWSWPTQPAFASICQHSQAFAGIRSTLTVTVIRSPVLWSLRTKDS